MKRWILVLAASAILSGETNATILYSQPDSPSVFGGYNSSNGNYRDYDQFKLASDGIVNKIDWVGLIQSPSQATSFEINFWSDNAGTPGTLPLYTYSIGSGSFSQTLAGTDSGYSLYDYSASVLPFAASANTTYWLSIEAQAPTEWFWHPAASQGDLGKQLFISGNTFSNTADAAFTLEDSPSATPEPASLTLLLGIGAGMAGYAWRRRKLAAG